MMWRKSGSPAPRESSSSSTDNQIAICRACDKGPTSFDVRHRVVLSAVYDIPVGRGRAFGANLPRAADLAHRYDGARRADVTSRTLAVDLLNRSLLSDFLPLQGARGLGLFLMDRVGPLRALQADRAGGNS